MEMNKPVQFDDKASVCERFTRSIITSMDWIIVRYSSSNGSGAE